MEVIMIATGEERN